MLFLVQTVVQLSFSMLILMWFFASFQIWGTGCMSSSQDYLGCTITKNVEEHWFREHYIHRVCLAYTSVYGNYFSHTGTIITIVVHILCFLFCILCHSQTSQIRLRLVHFSVFWVSWSLRRVSANSQRSYQRSKESFNLFKKYCWRFFTL